MKSVIVLSTGNELLHGDTIDTNGGFISHRLFPLALDVRLLMAVGDDPGDLERAIRSVLANNDILIISGGLGPTDDDNTIEALRRIIGFTVTIDEESRVRMEAFFKTMGMNMAANDLKMVEVPAGAEVIRNENGLAPGFIIRRNDKIIIAMPGVPREMTEMFDRSVMPFLKDLCGASARSSASFRVVGMKESDVNASIKTMHLPFERLTWGITARGGVTTVTVVMNDGSSFDFGGSIVEAKNIFGKRFLDPLYRCPEEEAIALLREKKLTVSFAESCTGGLVSKRITDISGSSDVFVGSIVAYSNRVKAMRLGVSEEALSTFGAVSEEVAGEMAAGARVALGSDIGISTTGIAGPGGGSEAKPVGMVCFGLADADRVSTFTRQLSGDREGIRMFASLIAIEYLRSYLK